MSERLDRYAVVAMTPIDIELDLVERATGLRTVAMSGSPKQQSGTLRPLEEPQLCHFGDGQPWPCPVHSGSRS